MSTCSLINIDALLAPIGGDAPEGDRKAYAYGLRDQLEALRQEERPEDFDDATRPAVLKKPDWKKAIALSTDALCTQSKDLRIACHLVEALTKQEGFAGLREGLELLKRLLDEAWDRLVPDIDDGDLDSRAAPLANMLDDSDRGLRFPTSVRFVPLFGSQPDVYGLVDWNRLRSSNEPADVEATASALKAMNAEGLAARTADAEACLQALQQLVQSMDTRMGSLAPSLTNLGGSVHDCARLMRQELVRMQPAAGATSATATVTAMAMAAADHQGDAGGAKAGGAVATGELSVSSRAEAYLQLTRAADVLQQMEPHSPIPYLVRRAVELGQLPFPRLMQQLIRDNNILTELNRELGIEESAAS